MRRRERVLVIGAHCDDESFGCLGALLGHKKQGAEFYFLWMTSGETERLRKQRKGASKVVRYFKAHARIAELMDQNLDVYPLVNLIEEVEWTLETFRPTVAYIPFIADLNKDHRLVSEATMVACRPYKKHVPKTVWMYDIPGSTEYGFRELQIDRQVYCDGRQKHKLLKAWYPQELVNGRDKILYTENFERWPRGKK